MVIEEARMDRGWLCLKTQPADSLRWLAKFQNGKNYEIKQIRQKRSKDANCYLWVLLDKLSVELGVPKEELYRRYIKEIGGVSTIVAVQNKAVDRFRREWESNGVGWQTDTIPIKTEGCTGVIVYYGSSTFDTKQMSRMIDSVVQDCQSVGIEVRPKEEIDSLLSEWVVKSE